LSTASKPVDPRHPAVQPCLHGQQKRRDDGCRRRRRHLSQNRRGAERKGQHKRHLGGQADVSIGLDLHEVADSQQGAECGQGHGEHDGRCERGKPGGDPAQERGQREGANAGDPLAFRVLALVPAALEPEQKPDGQRQAKPREDFCFIHWSHDG